MYLVSRIGFAVAAALSLSPGATAQSPATNAPPAAGVPRIVCLEPEFNYGDKADTDTVVHTFVLRNNGSAPLTIHQARASCGCTVATLSRKQIEPGGTGEIEARLSLRGRRGEQNKTISVESNDPATPRLTLWLKGRVTIELGFEPPYINFGQIGLGSCVTQATVLLSRRADVEVLGVSGSTERFRAEVLPDERGLKRRVRVTTIPPFAQGFSRAELTVRTSHPDTPELGLPVSALVPDAVYVIPKSLQLVGDAAVPLTRALLVRPGSVSGFKVLEVKVPRESIKSEISDMGHGNYRIQLTGLLPDPALDGKCVEVLTDAKGFETLRVPIRVVAPAVPSTPSPAK